MTMSLSLARPIVADPGGFSGVTEPGRIAWIILVARLPTSGGLLIAGGAIWVFGWTFIGEPSAGRGLPGRRWRLVAGPAGRPAGADAGYPAAAEHRDTGATVPAPSGLRGRGPAAGRGCVAAGARPGRAPRLDDRASTPSAVAGRHAPSWRPISKVSCGPSGLPMLMAWPSWMSITGTRRPLT